VFSLDTKAMYYPVSDRRIVAGEGVYLRDAEGNSFIDCASATFNLSLGYSHPAVVAAIQEQAEKLIHTTSSFQSEPVVRLASRLVELAPKKLTKAHLKVASGSSANEGAIKMAQRATGRRDVVTLFRSHVGQSTMLASLSGNAFRKEPLGHVYPGGLHVPDPYCLRCFYRQSYPDCGLLCVDRIEQFLEFASSGSVAAILIEPIAGNGGNIIPPNGYFQRLRQLCDAHDIKLLVDEVQTGIGRTGRMFACEHFGIEPDAMSLAKGLGGSGAQVAAILASDELAGLPADHHSFTYGANSLACAAALATLDVIDDPDFLAHVRAVGARILDRLGELKNRCPCILDVRGVGLMIGIEIARRDGSPDPQLTNILAKRAMDHALFLRTSRYGHGNVLKIRPPLILTDVEAELICDRLDDLLRSVTA